MEEQETVIESLVEHVEKYTSTTIELAKLKSILKLSDILSTIAVMVVLIIVCFLTIVLLSVGVSLWIGELVGSVYGGFLITGGFYAVTGLFIYLLRKRVIKAPVSNAIINHMMD
jgi:hypothetical protein